MIIVSQYKDVILNFDNVSLIAIGDEETNRRIYANCNNDDVLKLGVYESEERAKEVLKEIVKEYSSYLELKGGPAILKGDIDIQPNVFNIPKVYKMPEK